MRVSNLNELLKQTEENENGCLIWLGSMRGSYSQVSKKDGTQVYGHRLAFEFKFGKIPEGLVICHRCDEPLCVNPDHLFLGTCQDNSRDASKKGRLDRGESKYNSSLTEQVVIECRRRYVPYSSSNGASALAKEFGVPQKTLEGALQRRTWKWLD